MKEDDERSLIVKLVTEGLPHQWNMQLHVYTHEHICERDGLYLLTMELETNHSNVQRNYSVLSQ